MTFTPEIEIKLRQSFKQLNKFMLLMWRLGFGRWFNVWPEGIGQIMVITHTGRKTGLKRQTPVNYAILDGEIYCTAGFGKIADWYRNLRKNPEVEVWLPEGWWAGTAEDVTDSENRTELMRAVLIASGFAAPMFGLHPQQMSDEEIESVTKSYRLVRIRRTAERTGPEGPGDLAWVWQLTTLLLLPLALRRCKRK